MNTSSDLKRLSLPPLQNPRERDAERDTRFAEYERREEQRRKQEFDDRLLNCGLPKRLVDATFESFTTPEPRIADTLEKAREFAAAFVAGKPAPSRCALFYGAPGTGKTHLACAIMRTVGRHFGVRYTTVSDLARAVRSTYHRNATETEADVLELHTRPSLLTIDEVGVGLGTDHERAMLHDVVAGRYDDRKPTILISNLDLSDVCQALGDRLVDRIREDNGLVLPFGWGSFRGTSR